jgi:hypothetical protein
MEVLAARPPGAAGHGEDLVTGSLFEQGQAVTIETSRLSTTYNANGIPARASVELWPVSDLENAAGGDDEPAEPRPRRAAGEAIPPIASRSGRQLDVHAALFRWHAQGRQGNGVYVLARRR